MEFPNGIGIRDWLLHDAASEFLVAGPQSLILSPEEHGRLGFEAVGQESEIGIRSEPIPNP
jgi:hypothetical protein